MSWPGQRAWLRLLAARLWRQRGLVLAVVLLAVALGEAMLLWATWKWGLGANSDGLTYLVLARNWHRLGWYGRFTPAAWKPMTHFPPGYPQALAALMPFTQGDEELAARALAVVALAALVLLAAREVYGVTRHLWPTGAVALVLAVSFPVQRVVTLVLSEPLFLVQVLLLAWAVARWLGEPHPRRAVLVGLLAAWAIFTRWVGVAVLPWVALQVWWAWRRSRPRGWLWQAGLAALAAGLPVAALLAAGRWVAPAATGRVLRWHPPGPEKWQQAATTLAAWWHPWFVHWEPAREWAVAGATVVVFGALLAWAWRGARPQPVGRSLAEPFPQTPQLQAHLVRWGGWVAVYVGTLLAAIAWADASTPLDWRLLAPAFVGGVLALAGAAWVTLARRWPTALLLVWGLGVFLRVSWTYDQHFLLRKMHNLGAGLRNEKWQTAAVWPVLRSLPRPVTPVTNELRETEYYIDRPAWFLPPPPKEKDGQFYRYDVVTGIYTPIEVDPNRPWGEVLAETWRGKCVVLALITVGLEPDEAAAARQALAAGLTVWQEPAGGVLFLPPDAPACYNTP